MRAAVCREFGKPFVIEDLSLAPPQRGEVRCAVKAVAICHSDITVAEGGWGGSLPAVYGHEAAGVVLETGPMVHGLKPGDRVVITMVRHCGQCPCCHRGLHGACETHFPLDGASPILEADGTQVTQGLRTGAFAEEVVVEASQLVKIEEDVGYDIASLLACGVITGWGAVANTAKLAAGGDVAVIGTGGVGLNAVQACRMAGARTVIGIDLDEEKLEAARTFGATHTVNGREEDAVESVHRITETRGLDHVFVTVGAPQAFDQSYRMLGPGGVTVLVGVAANGAQSTFDPVTLTSYAQQILGSKLAADVQRDIPALVRHWREGRLKLEELVTRRFAFEDINEAMAAAKRGEGIRNVVMIGDAS
ncbi:MAG: Zn-dependent alcohol dehydrogenase [Pseudomonadota bacterium]